MLTREFSLFFLVALVVTGTQAVEPNVEQKGNSTHPPGQENSEAVMGQDEMLDMIYQMKVAKRVQDTLKKVKQLESGIEKTIHTNFLQTLFLMANGSAVIGQNVSRAAGTLIRGFVQDQFNLVSIGFYFPRLIFLDAPTQFIETLRLIRTNQIRIPTDMDSAIDTLINFAQLTRESQITMNAVTPFLNIWPNIFRGSELLATEVLYGVFSWLAPIAPQDISAAAVEGLWNRWDVKSSTTPKYNFDIKWKQ